MLNVKILSKDLKTEVGDLPLTALNNDKFSVASVHQVVKATLASRRQGNHSTKTRSMVSGGGIKPFKQKGTGRARQGSTRSPLMPGGGIAFGPSPRDYTQKLNKKQVLNALNTILIDKLNAGTLLVVESLDSSGKTSELNNLLNQKGVESVYIVTSSKDDLVHRAARNLPKVKSAAASGFSIYESVKYSNLLLTKSSLDELLKRLVK